MAARPVAATSSFAPRKRIAATKPPVDGIKALVVLSDLHCGGTTALLPPEFTLLEGQTIKGNAAQRFLWCKWEQFWADVYARLDGRPFALVLNGDLIEGNHHRTRQIISPDAGDHVNAAYECLREPASRAAKVFVVEGTDCHTGNAEHALAKMLKAVPDPNAGRPAWERLDLTVHGCPCAFQHHMPATSREYLRSNGLGIMLGNEQLAAARAGEARPRVLGMAHRHLFDMVAGSYGMAFATPCWQFGTRHVFKVAPHAAARRFETGGVLLDWEHRELGDLPDFCPLIYRPREHLSATGPGMTV